MPEGNLRKKEKGNDYLPQAAGLFPQKRPKKKNSIKRIGKSDLL